MLHRLAGMFAFALWDENRRRLLVARDRFGKKPLYYSRRGGEMVFGSEIKALLAAGVPADLDDAALEDYLALRYVPAPRTLFRSVRQLPAGHKMVISDDGFEVQRWWRLRYDPKPALTLAQSRRRRRGPHAHAPSSGASSATCRSDASCREASTPAPCSRSCRS